jgi:hypothetical protein
VLRRLEDDEQFSLKGEPSIVLNKAGLRRERRRADAESGSEVVAAKRRPWPRVGDGTRGEEDANRVGSLGFARTGSDSNHAP